MAVRWKCASNWEMIPAPSCGAVTNQLNQVVATGGPYDESNSEVTDELDLPPGCYTFKAEDQTRSLAPDAVVRVKRGGNTLLVAADLEEPYSKGLRAGTLQACSYPIDLELRTDEAANETAYEIRSADGGTIHCTGGGISGGAQTLINGCCLPEGCYQLRVMDAGGDGIAGGGYILREGNGSLRRIIDNKDGFGDGRMSAIAGGEVSACRSGTMASPSPPVAISSIGERLHVALNTWCSTRMPT